MAAITWRNVDGPSLGEASGILTAAGNSFNAGLGTLDKLLKQREDIQAKNWEATKINNGEAYKNLAATAKTPEELAALQPQLAQLSAGFNGQVDQGMVRDHAANLTDTLRKREATALAYSDAQRTRAEAPIQEAYRVAVLNGDEATQAQIRAANPGLRNWSTLRTEEQATELQMAQAKRTAELAPLQHKNAITQVEDQATQLTTARAVTALEKEAAAAAQSHRQRQDTFGESLAAIAKGNKLDLPVDGRGRVQLDLLTSDQYTALQTAVEKQLPKGSKAPNILKMYEAGDTEAADAFVNGLAGKYDPALIEKTRAGLRGAFDTNAGQTEVGRNAANIARAAAKQKVVDDEDRSTNWHSPGSANAMNNYEIVAKELPMLIDKTTGFGTDEDVGPLQDFLHRMATVGVDVGKGKMVTPSVNDLRAVIRSAEGGWFKDATRASDAENKLIKVMRASGSIAKIEKAEGIQIRDRTRAFQAELKASTK